MALIRVREHSVRDIDAWNVQVRADRVVARSSAHAKRVTRALQDIEAFVRMAEKCYAGVSWGKDSTVLAHLLYRVGVDVPCVWVRVEPIANPHCTLVRDAFLSRFGVRYAEIEQWCARDDGGEWHARGTLERGFDEAARRYGAAYLSGIRADESGTRKLRMTAHGVATTRTCAPIGWWTGADVFAYLYANDLPVHPAYAMSMAGAIERARLRVASLGGKRGDGMGRAEWEQRYYGWRLRQIAHVSAG